MDAMAGLEETQEYLEVIALFLQKKVQIIYKEFTNTLLMVTANNNLYYTAKLLMDHYNNKYRKRLSVYSINTYINAKDEEGKTTLIHAVINCNKFLKIDEKDQKKKKMQKN